MAAVVMTTGLVVTVVALMVEFGQGRCGFVTIYPLPLVTHTHTHTLHPHIDLSITVSLFLQLPVLHYVLGISNTRVINQLFIHPDLMYSSLRQSFRPIRVVKT